MSRRAKRMLLLGIIVILVWIAFRETATVRTNIVATNQVIVIDAGHGGKDPGTIGFSGYYEKDMNLAVAQKLKKQLQKLGYTVVMTRDEDEYVDNALRAQLANNKKAGLFISIHGNAVEQDSSVNGVQVLYYPNGASKIDNRILADTFKQHIIKATNAKDRGSVAREDLIVLNQTQMPALIVECGFLTNKAEEQRLRSEAYQQKVVDGIVAGLDAYIHLQNEG